MGTEVFLSFDLPATEKQGIDCKKKQHTDISFLLFSFLLPFLDQHDTVLECWIIVEPLHFISLGFGEVELWSVGWYSRSSAIQYLMTTD